MKRLSILVVALAVGGVAAVGVGTTAASAAPPVTIFSNLGSGSSVYQAGTGWTVSAPGSGVGLQVWPAEAFTPSASAVATQIDIAVSVYSGTNALTVQLAVDNGSGLPGAVLRTVNVTGLPVFGTCCALDTVAVAPVPVIKGQQYWLIARPGASDTWDAWNFSNSAFGTLAENEGSGWIAEGYTNQGAFDVLGYPCAPPVPPNVAGCLTFGSGSGGGQR